MGYGGKAASQGKMGSGGILERKYMLIWAGIAFCVSGMVAVLFYNSPWGLCSLPAAFILTGRVLKDQKRKHQLAQLSLEFKDYLYAINGLLLAGYSIERAFLGGLWDVEQLHGTECILAKRLGAMEQRLNLNEPIENILRDFAETSSCEDVKNFVEIFCYAKRSGGDFTYIIMTASGRICDKQEVIKEIHTVMAEKALEQKVMCVVPLGILLFFRMTSPEFIGKLYGNLLGVIVMTAALFLYSAAFFLGMKLVEIEV